MTVETRYVAEKSNYSENWFVLDTKYMRYVGESIETPLGTKLTKYKTKAEAEAYIATFTARRCSH